MRSLLKLLLLVSVLSLGACSTPFERQWRQPVASRTAGEYDGKWEGTWRSQKHRNAGGRLRCILTEQSPNTFHAQFKADWMIFSSGYGTRFTGVRKGKSVEFHGRENLGPLFGGDYTFKGRADWRRFVASYDSSYDTGTFEMTRVPGSSAAGR